MAVSEGNIAGMIRRWRRPQKKEQKRIGVPPGQLDALAEEVFQRLSRIDDEKGAQDPQGQLFRVAANVANEFKGDDFRPDSIDDVFREPTIEVSIAQNFLRNKVFDMPLRQQQALILHVEGLTYKQIAERMGVPNEVVLRSLTIAYSTLRMKIVED